MRHQQLKRILIHNIENSGLEIGAAYFVVKDVLGEVEKEYSKHIEMQMEQIKKTEEKKNDNTDS